MNNGKEVTRRTIENLAAHLRSQASWRYRVAQEWDDQRSIKAAKYLEEAADYVDGLSPEDPNLSGINADGFEFEHPGQEVDLAVNDGSYYGAGSQFPDLVKEISAAVVRDYWNWVGDLQEETKRVEDKLRRSAKRQGLKLEKSRSRDISSNAYGTYRLTNPANNTIICYAGYNDYGMTLQEIEEALSE